MELEYDIQAKQFDMLHSLLSELQQRLTRTTFAAAGFLLLGVGWFASEDVGAFLKDHPRPAWIVVLAPLIAAALYCYNARLAYKRSQKIAATLRHLDAVNSEIYEHNLISRGQFLIFSGAVVLLSLILAGCIYLAVHSPAPDTNADEVLMQVSLLQPHITTPFAQL